MKRPLTLHGSLPGLRHILLFFRPRLRRHHRLVAASSLAMLAEVVLGTLEPWPLKFIFDHVLGAHRGRMSAFSAFESLDVSTIITVSALAIILIAGARALADYASTLGFARAANRVLAEVRGDLYRHVQGLSLSFHNKARSGDLLLRLMNDVNQLRDVAVTAVVPLVADRAGPVRDGWGHDLAALETGCARPHDAPVILALDGAAHRANPASGAMPNGSGNPRWRPPRPRRSERSR